MESRQQQPPLLLDVSLVVGGDDDDGSGQDGRPRSPRIYLGSQAATQVSQPVSQPVTGPTKATRMNCQALRPFTHDKI